MDNMLLLGFGLRNAWSVSSHYTKELIQIILGILIKSVTLRSAII